MHRILTLAGAALIAATLAACSPGVNLLGHRITFDSSGMVVHAPGQPNAHVSRDGNLSIDGKEIAVTPAQRQLLQSYYQQAHGVMDSGAAMGKQGIRMAERGIADAIASIFHKDASTADKQMNAQSQKIETAADALCTNVRALGTTEKTIAADLPAFAPYAGNARMQCRITRSTTVRSSGGSTTTTSTSSFVVATGNNGAEARTSAATREHPAPASETSHQP